MRAAGKPNSKQKAAGNLPAIADRRPKRTLSAGGPHARGDALHRQPQQIAQSLLLGRIDFGGGMAARCMNSIWIRFSGSM